ncbi:hypothetical protein, partial [Burkholderia sp. MSh2]|uniref:hypothetical protein n=1 Tax=Burkholderia sp. MSh2 TaxID=1506588 RepID=UPI001F424EF4
AQRGGRPSGPGEMRRCAFHMKRRIAFRMPAPFLAPALPAGIFGVSNGFRFLVLGRGKNR